MKSYVATLTKSPWYIECPHHGSETYMSQAVYGLSSSVLQIWDVMYERRISMRCQWPGQPWSAQGQPVVIGGPKLETLVEAPDAFRC